MVNILAKVIVAYESKYGNTKLVAETIIEGIKEVGKIEIVLSELKEVDLNKVTDYDAILIGSPNHWGGPTRGVRKFIDKLSKPNLERKLFAFFDTCLGTDFEKAVKKMEKRINEKIPGLKQIAPGLSIKVGGMKGPLVEDDLSKCREFGNRIATQIET